MGSLTFVSLESIVDGSLIHETSHHSISPDLLTCGNRLELYCSAPSEDTLCLNVIGTGLCLVSVVSTFNGEPRTIDVEQEENIQAKLTVLEGQFTSTFSINGKTLLGQKCTVAADDNRTGVSGLADLSSLLNDTENILTYDPDSFSNGDVNEYIKNADNNDDDVNGYGSNKDSDGPDFNESNKNDESGDDVNEYSSDEDSDGADVNESTKNADTGDDVSEYSSDEDSDGADVNEFTKNADTGDDVNEYSWDEDSDGADVNEFTKNDDTGDDVNEYSWEEDSDGADVNEFTKNDDNGDDVYGVGDDEKEHDDDKRDCDDEEFEVSASSENKFGIPVFKTEVSMYNTYGKTVSKDRRTFRCTQCRSTSSSLGTYKDTAKERGRIETDIVDIRTHRTKLLKIMQAIDLSDYFFEAELISEENMIDVNESWKRRGKRAANSCLLDILRNRQILKKDIETVLIKAEEKHLLALMFPQQSKLVSVGTQTKASFDKVMTEVFNESDTSRPVLFSYHF